MIKESILLHTSLTHATHAQKLMAGLLAFLLLFSQFSSPAGDVRRGYRVEGKNPRSLYAATVERGKAHFFDFTFEPGSRLFRAGTAKATGDPNVPGIWANPTDEELKAVFTKDYHPGLDKGERGARKYSPDFQGILKNREGMGGGRGGPPPEWQQALDIYLDDGCQEEGTTERAEFPEKEKYGETHEKTVIADYAPTKIEYYDVSLEPVPGRELFARDLFDAIAAARAKLEDAEGFHGEEFGLFSDQTWNFGVGIHQVFTQEIDSKSCKGVKLLAAWVRLHIQAKEVKTRILVPRWKEGTPEYAKAKTESLKALFAKDRDKSFAKILEKRGSEFLVNEIKRRLTPRLPPDHVPETWKRFEDKLTAEGFVAAEGFVLRLLVKNKIMTAAEAKEFQSELEDFVVSNYLPNPQAVESWNLYLKNLIAHEREHERIYTEQYFNKLKAELEMAAKKGFGAASSNRIKVKVLAFALAKAEQTRLNFVAWDLYDKTRAEQRRYDDVTKHGSQQEAWPGFGAGDNIAMEADVYLSHLPPEE